MINSRLHYILRHITGDDWNRLLSLLDSTRSVLLGGSALDIVLYGTSPIHNHELRIAIPNDAKHAVAMFFKSLGFVSDDSPSFYTPPSLMVTFDYAHIHKGDKKVTLIVSPTNSVLPIVLAHRSSTDCMFISSGGLFFGYPELISDQYTFMPMSHPRSSMTRFFTQREYEVKTNNNSWTTPCEIKCPTLWRRMDDGLFVVWNNGVTPHDIMEKEEFQWRLTSHCANLSCWNNIFRNYEPFLGAYTTSSVNLRITQLISNNVRESFLSNVYEFDKLIFYLGWTSSNHWAFIRIRNDASMPCSAIP